MSEEHVPYGTQWGGLNRKVDPVDISPEQGQDADNCFFFEDKVGLLGPRRGKTKAGVEAYTILGICPYHPTNGDGGQIVASGDSVSTTINVYTGNSALYTSTTPGGSASSASGAPVEKNKYHTLGDVLQQGALTGAWHDLVTQLKTNTWTKIQLVFTVENLDSTESLIMTLEVKFSDGTIQELEVFNADQKLNLACSELQLIGEGTPTAAKTIVSVRASAASADADFVVTADEARFLLAFEAC
jgi:hypothetical protein